MKKSLIYAVPTPPSLWHLGYYQIPVPSKQYIMAEWIENSICLSPELTGYTIGKYSTGDSLRQIPLDLIRGDLRRNNVGWEGISVLPENIEIRVNQIPRTQQCWVWGFPILEFIVDKCQVDDYIVARLITDAGEIVSFGVTKIQMGINTLEMRPLFIPGLKSSNMHLFINRSWVPVLFPTLNMDVINIRTPQLYLPIITEEISPLNMYPDASDMIFNDVKFEKIEVSDNKVICILNWNGTKWFQERLEAEFNLGVSTSVKVHDKYPQIETITEIHNCQPNIYDIGITCETPESQLIAKYQYTADLGLCTKTYGSKSI